MENTGSPDELQPAAHRSPETAGRRSPSKHSLAGQGRRAHDLPRVEMLNLGSWTLQGACKSTVAQHTKEGRLWKVSLRPSAYFRGTRGQERPTRPASGAGTQPLVQGLVPAASAQGLCSLHRQMGGQGSDKASLGKVPRAQHPAPCSPAPPSQTGFTLDHRGAINPQAWPTLRRRCLPAAPLTETE